MKRESSRPAEPGAPSRDEGDPEPTTTFRQSDAVVEGMPRLWSAGLLRGSVQPRWLAKSRLPRAAISLLVGDEGIGKSLLWVWIVAAVTRGRAVDEFGIPERPPGEVILICTEDDWSTTVRPRLEVADADLNLIRVICTDDDGSGAPTFPRDLYLIREADPQPVLIVVDAWLDTVPLGLSVRDPQQARQALHPWHELATGTDAAVLLVTHTNRVASADPREKYGATGELRKKARMTLFAQADENGHLVVGPEKANTASAVQASVFRITAIQHFIATEDGDGTVPLLQYLGASDRTARQHLADSVEENAPSGTASPAQRFIRDFLRQEGGEAATADVLKAGKDAGFGEQELKDARRRSRRPRVTSRKSNFGDGWVWAIDGLAEGGNATQGGQGGGANAMRREAPPSPPSPPSTASSTVAAVPPGGVRPTTPGQTERVQRALEAAQAARAATDTCPKCGQPARTGHEELHNACRGPGADSAA